jgi:hypothetical protein
MLGFKRIEFFKFSEIVEIGWANGRGGRYVWRE